MQRERNLLFIIVAFIFALLASGGVYYYLNVYEHKLLADSGIMVDVVATNIDLKVGTEIKPYMLGTIQWPKKKVISTHILNKEAVVGKVVTANIPKGFPLLKNMLINKKNNITNLIPAKMRAMTIQTEGNKADAAFIKPDVWVDVLATYNIPGEAPYTKTILKNIKIIAVNGLTSSLYANNTIEKIDEITVLIKSKDVEKLALAKNEAKIQVVLRNQNDTDDIEEPTSDLPNLKNTFKQIVPKVKEYAKPITVIRGTEVKKVRLK